MVQYDGFAAAVIQEQALVDKVRAATTALHSEAAVISWWESEVLAEPEVVRHLPPSLEDAVDDSLRVQPDIDGKYRWHEMDVRRGANKRSRFVLPGEGRANSGSSSSNQPMLNVISWAPCAWEFGPPTEIKV